MMGWVTPTTTGTDPIPHTDDAEAYVAMVCFKHGPPLRTGVELEWTVHDDRDPGRTLDLPRIAAALGVHAPTTVAPHSPHAPLPDGSLVTVEPGGQVELSSLPDRELGSLLAAVERDTAALDALLEPAGLRRGDSGIDPARPPLRLLEVPRYAAMQQFLDGHGPHGSAMMCSTASTQVCLDAGERADVALRWRALHSIGPALVALFANSPVVGGVRTGWASNRLRATLGTCPPFTHPVAYDGDPVTMWVQRVMSAPVMCVRREAGPWSPRRPMSFADWVCGADGTRPTLDDLDYHLTTLFPPVRPRGYVEVRYLDTQPAATWHHPVVLLGALFSRPEATARAVELTEHCADMWLAAAERGLADETLRRAARDLVDLAADHPDPTLDPACFQAVIETLHRRTHAAGAPEPSDRPADARRQPA
jgi:glutamate--cysteine ligase